MESSSAAVDATAMPSSAACEVSAYQQTGDGSVVGSSVWQPCVDENSGYTYYWNTLTNQVTWSTPVVEYSALLQPPPPPPPPPPDDTGYDRAVMEDGIQLITSYGGDTSDSSDDEQQQQTLDCSAGASSKPVYGPLLPPSSTCSSLSSSSSCSDRQPLVAENGVCEAGCAAATTVAGGATQPACSPPVAAPPTHSGHNTGAPAADDSHRVALSTQTLSRQQQLMMSSSADTPAVTAPATTAATSHQTSDGGGGQHQSRRHVSQSRQRRRQARALAGISTVPLSQCTSAVSPPPLSATGDHSVATAGGGAAATGGSAGAIGRAGDLDTTPQTDSIVPVTASVLSAPATTINTAAVADAVDDCCVDGGGGGGVRATASVTPPLQRQPDCGAECVPSESRACVVPVAEVSPALAVDGTGSGGAAPAQLGVGAGALDRRVSISTILSAIESEVPPDHCAPAAGAGGAAGGAIGGGGDDLDSVLADIEKEVPFDHTAPPSAAAAAHQKRQLPPQSAIICADYLTSSDDSDCDSDSANTVVTKDDSSGATIGPNTNNNNKAEDMHVSGASSGHTAAKNGRKTARHDTDNFANTRCAAADEPVPKRSRTVRVEPVTTGATSCDAATGCDTATSCDIATSCVGQRSAADTDTSATALLSSSAEAGVTAAAAVSSSPSIGGATSRCRKPRALVSCYASDTQSDGDSDGASSGVSGDSGARSNSSVAATVVAPTVGRARGVCVAAAVAAAVEPPLRGQDGSRCGLGFANEPTDDGASGGAMVDQTAQASMTGATHTTAPHYAAPVCQQRQHMVQFVRGETLTPRPHCDNVHHQQQQQEREEDESDDLISMEDSESTSTDLVGQFDTVVGKLHFLGADTAQLPAMSARALECQTLYTAWQRQALSADYLLQWLLDQNTALVQLERQSVPPGWTISWHRKRRCYMYREQSTGRVSWQFPDLLSPDHHGGVSPDKTTAVLAPPSPSLAPCSGADNGAVEATEVHTVAGPPPGWQTPPCSSLLVTESVASAGSDTSATPPLPPAPLCDQSMLQPPLPTESSPPSPPPPPPRPTTPTLEMLSELHSFYTEVGQLQHNEQQATTATTTAAAAAAANATTAAAAVVSQPTSLPIAAQSTPFPTASTIKQLPQSTSQPNTAQSRTTKRKKKLSSALSLKKKGVDQLVAKWQSVQKQLQ